MLDASQVLEQVQQDESCSLHVLDDDLGDFDLAFAFRSGFSAEHPGFVDEVSHELLKLNENGVAEVRATRAVLWALCEGCIGVAARSHRSLHQFADGFAVPFCASLEIMAPPPAELLSIAGCAGH